jgi:N-acetylglucosaminyl-diphospho-decaprenol L-rhamnosyltransferase
MAGVHPKNKHVAALMAVHNRLALTQRCVACLRAAADGARLEIVVVDDGSTDGTGEWLAAQPDVTVLRGDGGLWFGGAMDRGLRHLNARGAEGPEFVLILNNDTYVRPGALARMIAEAGPRTVVATAYWTEDRRELSTTGYVWKRWNGLVDASRTKQWPVDGGRPTVAVDAVSTTVVLVPAALLRAAKLPDAALHPHNRYDAILSARLRDAGAAFVCVTEMLADHEYGPAQARSSVRRMSLGKFLAESFRERRSIWHLKGGLALAWESAPNGMEAVCVWLSRVLRFLRQLAWVSVNSLGVVRKITGTEVRA